ncbi:MAG: hypothetical protein WBM83_07730, partial [Flavobacteriaceae bacterium]
MKKNYTILPLVIGLFFCLQYSIAQTEGNQETDQRISLSFENATILDVLNAIEEKTGFHFFYADAWLGDTLVSGSYSNVEVSSVLDAIFKDTALNYYVYSDD